MIHILLSLKQPESNVSGTPYQILSMGYGVESVSRTNLVMQTQTLCMMIYHPTCNV